MIVIITLNYLFYFKGWDKYNIHENCPIFKTSHPQLRPRFHPHNPKITIMSSDPSFRSALLFSINSLTLSGFSLTSFHLVNASVCLVVVLYPCVCSCHEISRNVFYLKLFIFLVLNLQSTRPDLVVLHECKILISNLPGERLVGTG